MDKVDSIQKQMGSEAERWKFWERPKRNARYHKHCNRNEGCMWLAY